MVASESASFARGEGPFASFPVSEEVLGGMLGAFCPSGRNPVTILADSWVPPGVFLRDAVLSSLPDRVCEDTGRIVNKLEEEAACADSASGAPAPVCSTLVSMVLFMLRLLYLLASSALPDLTAMSSWLSLRCVSCEAGRSCVDWLTTLARGIEAAAAWGAAFGVVLPDSVRGAAARRYRPGEGFAGWSKLVSERSGTAEDKLINDEFFDPITESSFADGCEEASDDVVEELDTD